MTNNVVAIGCNKGKHYITVSPQPFQEIGLGDGRKCLSVNGLTRSYIVR